MSNASRRDIRAVTAMALRGRAVRGSIFRNGELYHERNGEFKCSKVVASWSRKRYIPLLPTVNMVLHLHAQKPRACATQSPTDQSQRKFPIW